MKVYRSKAETDALANRLKNIAPIELVAHGIIQPAPNYSDKLPRYICPFCGSGTHENQTSAFSPKYMDGVYKWFCQSCMEKGNGKDNIHIFAEHFHLDSRRDFIEIINRAAKEFGITDLQQETVHRPHNPPTKPTITPERLKLINDTISDSQKNLRGFIEGNGGFWRGLPLEILQHFRAGYLMNWHHSKKTLRSPRIIIPASTEFDTANYLARLTVPIDTFNKEQRNFICDKEHDGEKTLFNPDALSAETILVVEGYIDAISIFYASGGSIAVVALGAANQGATLLKAIDEKNITGKKFIILFDADQRQKDFPKDLRGDLQKRGNSAVVKFLFDFLPDSEQQLFGIKVDANQLLQETDKEFLYQLLQTVITDAQTDFSRQLQTAAQDKALADKIAQWQNVNGSVNPDTLAKLKDAATRIDELSVITAETAKDTSIHKHLGFFRYYSFFSFIEERFLARLKDAKADAKKIVSAFKKDNTKPAPSDDQSFLASIDVHKLSAKIETYFTQAKREHRNFLAQKELDDLNAKRKAEHEQYLNDPPTTKKFVHDCPVDLILPEGIFFSENGISMVDFDKPAGRNGRPVIEIAQCPIVPSRRFADSKTDFINYEVSIKDPKRNGKWRKVIVDGRTLSEARSVTELANNGALISDSRMLVKFFAKIIGLPENADRLPECKMFTQPGWTSDDCTEFVFPPGDKKDFFVHGFNFDFELAFAKRGNTDEWLKMYRKVLKTSIVSRLTIAAALSAPLVAPLNIRNLQLHLSSPSSSGKSAAVKFALSLFGNPEKMKFTFNGTANSLDTQAGAFNDLPSYIDELQSANKKVRENIDTVIYNYAEGVNKSRNQKTNALQPRNYFHGTRLSTGEQNLTNDFSGEGAIARILEVTRSDIIEEKFAVKVHQFCNQHYGLFGPQWIQFIIQNKATIVDKFNFLEALYGNETGIFRAHAVAMAAFHTAFIFFNQMLGFDAAKVEKACVKDFATMLEAGDFRQKSASTNAARAAARVQEFIQANPRSFYIAHRNSQKLILPDKATNELFGILFEDGSVGFFPNQLKTAVLADFPNADAVVRAFAENGFIRGGSANKKHLYQRCLRFDNKRYWVYRFKPESDDSEFDE